MKQPSAIIAAMIGLAGEDGAEMLDNLDLMGETLSTYHFTIQDEEEHRSLRWLAGRYDPAQLLLDCVGDPEHYPWPVEVPEHVAWNILDATEGDGADRGIVPCLGGRLGDEIHAMLESVI
jgi:hypothetical protein